MPTTVENLYLVGNLSLELNIEKQIIMTEKK